MKEVFFNKFVVNDTTGSCTLSVVSAPMSVKKGTLAGLQVASKKQLSRTFGLLSLTDPDTGQVMKANHPTMVQLRSKLEKDSHLNNVAWTNNPVLNIETGEETGMFWCEFA